MRTVKTPLRGLTEIYRYLRCNETPIYVIMPTPFNLMGLDQWVGGLEYVNYFDIFDGRHPRVFLPTQTEPQDFRSMEDVGNYLGSVDIHREAMMAAARCQLAA